MSSQRSTVRTQSIKPPLTEDAEGPLIDFAAGRLSSLCHAAGLVADADRIVATFRRLVSPWAASPRGESSGWSSEVSDDNTPIEFSAAIEHDRADVRVLFEPQGAVPTIASFRAASLAFHERLGSEFGAHLDRLRQVQDLFLPAGMRGPFAAWCSAVFSANEPDSFKLYLNPQARGAADAPALVAAGLRTLGAGGAWPALEASVLARGPELDELKYFALDLSSEPRARIKVYVRHHDATAEQLEHACSGARSYAAGEALEFVKAMSGDTEVLRVRAPFTCSSFVADDLDRPLATTLYVPVCAYAHDDAAAHRRFHDYLVQSGTDPALYDAIVRGFANRPLQAGVGMQSWFAFRRQGQSARFTVYLATEANHVHAPGEIPAPTAAVRLARTAPQGSGRSRRSS
ncbi:MAG TPA: tryptophan dimethylallyltransferase family protein [Polyangiaceae bacterium]|nr:tryptophan dimethylallyltransferase family protein [Polyangiaceae bacterium]